MTGHAYPSDLDDDIYHFMLPYLLLTPKDARQRKYSMRDVLNLLFSVVSAGV